MAYVTLFLDDGVVDGTIIMLRSRVYKPIGLCYGEFTNHCDVMATIFRYPDGTRRVSLYDYVLPYEVAAEGFADIILDITHFDNVSYQANVRLRYRGLHKCLEDRVGVLCNRMNEIITLAGVPIEHSRTRQNFLRAELLLVSG